MYKIKLDDNSFIMAEENYKFTLFKHNKKKIITIKDYLNENRYLDYYLIDLIDNTKIKRKFTIESVDSSDLPIGKRFKLAKDIKVGDLILGVNDEPKRVKELHTGEDEMFEININDHSYIVNGGHILALVNKETGEHLEMPVNVYMHMDNEFKSYYVMEQKV